MSTDGKQNRAAHLGDISDAFDRMWRTMDASFSKTDRSAFMSYMRFIKKLATELVKNSYCLSDKSTSDDVRRIAQQIEQQIDRIPILDN